jgi:hypothetical protein
MRTYKSIYLAIFLIAFLLLASVAAYLVTTMR